MIQKKYPPKSVRFSEFIENLNKAEPSSSREESLSLMKELMKSVEDKYGLPTQDLSVRMHVYSWDFGWKDLDKNPCYWDDSWVQTHRTELYHEGRIVITRLKAPIKTVIDKPGA